MFGLLVKVSSTQLVELSKIFAGYVKKCLILHKTMEESYYALSKAVILLISSFY